MMSTPCKHHELMAEYAKDAATMEEPWDAWEINSAQGWIDCIFHPTWNTNLEYRRKQKTIRIGKYDVPEPMRVKPKNGDYYYVPNIIGTFRSYVAIWGDYKTDICHFDNGLCHPTKETAELHAKALISLTARGAE